jgi:hypothetical protein
LDDKDEFVATVRPQQVLEAADNFVLSVLGALIPSLLFWVGAFYLIRKLYVYVYR